MALRGNLRDFSLPDVFQLVTFSRKTGVLRIAREGGDEGSVWFRDGDIFFASSNWRTELLGERLVRAQRITPQALKRALALRAEEPEDGRRLGQILVDEGYITEEVLQAFVQEQIQDTIFDLMRWDEGDFDFEAMPEVVDEDIGLIVSIENVVMEGARRLEEWNRIRKKIPSVEVVFKMATAPGEGTFEISLKPTEWQLLLLVDCTRSVAELASETGRTDFEVARVLYGLFSAGLLEFASDEEIEHNRAERAAREAKLAQLEAERRAEAEAKQAARDRPVRGARSCQGRSRQGAVGPDTNWAALGRRRGGTGRACSGRTVQAGRGAHLPRRRLGRALRRRPSRARRVHGGRAGPAVVEQPEVKPSAPAKPHTPVEEPAFMSDAARDNEMVDEPEALIEDLLGMTPQPLPEPEPVVEVPAVEPEPVVEVAPEPEPEPVVEPEPEPEPEPVVEVAPEPEPEPRAGTRARARAGCRSRTRARTRAAPVVEVAARARADREVLPEVEEALAPEPVTEPEPEIVPEPISIPEVFKPAPEPAVEPVAQEQGLDFERDLMALGLGELPSDLLDAAEAGEPMAAEAEALATEEPEPEPVLEWLEEPAEEEEPVAEASAEPTVEPETPVVDHVVEPASIASPEPAPAAETLPEAEEVEPAHGREAGDELDFSALIESLDVDADDFTDLGPAKTDEAPVDVGFDEDLLRDESPVVPGKVISTDAYLSDITMDDLGFSGGLTDELSALTGAKRRANARPQANVNSIPDEGSAVLKRDARVDKDTLLKIIDGIKDL